MGRDLSRVKHKYIAKVDYSFVDTLIDEFGTNHSMNVCITKEMLDEDVWKQLKQEYDEPTFFLEVEDFLRHENTSNLIEIDVS